MRRRAVTFGGSMDASGRVALDMGADDARKHAKEVISPNAATTGAGLHN
jgi:hypothetical protein